MTNRTPSNTATTTEKNMLLSLAAAALYAAQNADLLEDPDLQEEIAKALDHTLWLKTEANFRSQTLASSDLYHNEGETLLSKTTIDFSDLFENPYPTDDNQQIVGYTARTIAEADTETISITLNLHTPGGIIYDTTQHPEIRNLTIQKIVARINCLYPETVTYKVVS